MRHKNVLFTSISRTFVYGRSHAYRPHPFTPAGCDWKREIDLSMNLDLAITTARLSFEPKTRRPVLIGRLAGVIAAVLLLPATGCDVKPRSSSPPASNPQQSEPVKLSAGVALPQTLPSGTALGFSMDYVVLEDLPTSDGAVKWVIESAQESVEVDVHLDSRGNPHDICPKHAARTRPVSKLLGARFSRRPHGADFPQNHNEVRTEMTYALLLSSLMLFAPGDDNVLFTDSFDGKLQTGWKWIREDAEPMADPRRCAPHAIATGRHLGWQRCQERTHPQPQTIRQCGGPSQCGTRPEEEMGTSGLLWYVDDDNFVKLISEHIDGKMFAVLASEEGGRGRVFGKILMPQANVQLRMLIQSNRVTGQWRVKETDDWSDCGNCEFKVKGTPHFGLFTQTGPDNATRWVQFDKFVVLKTKK